MSNVSTVLTLSGAATTGNLQSNVGHCHLQIVNVKMHLINHNQPTHTQLSPTRPLRCLSLNRPKPLRTAAHCTFAQRRDRAQRCRVRGRASSQRAWLTRQNAVCRQKVHRRAHVVAIATLLRLRCITDTTLQRHCRARSPMYCHRRPLHTAANCTANLCRCSLSSDQSTAVLRLSTLSVASATG